VSVEAEIVDEELVRRSLAARDAFEALVHRYYRMAYGIAYAHVGQREAAEEVAQEALLRAYLNLGKLQQPARFPAWLGTIARNVAEDWRIRSQTRSNLIAMVPLEALERELPDTRSVSPRDKVQADQQAACVRAAITRLPTPQRELVMLHFLEGLSKTEIARRLGVYPSAVGRKLERAVSFLKRELKAPLPEAIGSVAPSQHSPRRAAFVISAAASLPHSARMALELAAGTAHMGLAAISFQFGSESTSLLHKFVTSLTSGGKGMLVIKGTAIAGALAAVVAGGIHHRAGSTPGQTDTGVVSGGRTVSAAVTAPRGVTSAAGDVQSPEQNGAVAQSSVAAEPVGGAQRPARAEEKLLAQAPASAQQKQGAPVAGGAQQMTVRQAPAAAPAVAAVTPDALNAAILQKVSRTKADMRSLATGIESYFVDNNAYPASDAARSIRKPAAGESALPSFQSYCITTPIAYLARFMPDSFSSEGQPFVYRSVENKGRPTESGWILVSPGPDGRFDVDPNSYDPAKPQPQPWLVELSYDPTNGTVSKGDIWRVKQ
jgi:RNA polymerase sigma factor (sigma-70 family)